MIDIQPQHVTLDQLVYGRLFRIPQYQRTYSWRKKQRQDLFEDIRRAAEKECSHFMATIVGLRREKRTIMTKEHQVIEVVDGQQRITTLILLLKAIAKVIDRSDPIGGKIGKELDDTLVKDDKATLLLLQTNHDISHYFADYLRTGNQPPSEAADTLADRELLSAIEECERFVTNWQSAGNSLEDLVSLLKNLALRNNFVVSKVELHSREVPFDQLPIVIQRIMANWGRMSIMDTKPFMPPATLHSIFGHKPPVIGTPA